MALNNTELKLLKAVIKKFHVRPKILFLGYPDLISFKSSWPFDDICMDDVPRRPGTENAWKEHNFPWMRGELLLDTKKIFEILGSEPYISDGILWGGEDYVLDLNFPINKSLEQKFDIIVDPGTIEHCFNILQAFKNISLLLKDKGYVYHQAACCFPNHGLFSISPTAFFDWYENQDFLCHRPKVWTRGGDEAGASVIMDEIDPFKIGQNIPGNGVCSYLFQKPSNHKLKNIIPTQRCYSSLKRSVDYNLDFY